MDADYSTMTDEEEDAILRKLCRDAGTCALLDIGDVYTIVREEFNNAILDTWAHENPERAFPKQEEE